MMERKFVCSAVTFVDTDGSLVTVRGKRHHDCFKKIHDDGYDRQWLKTKQEGFIVSVDGMELFLNREEATKIAYDLGIKKTIGSVLTSEDLW